MTTERFAVESIDELPMTREQITLWALTVNVKTNYLVRLLNTLMPPNNLDDYNREQRVEAYSRLVKWAEHMVRTFPEVVSVMPTGILHGLQYNLYIAGHHMVCVEWHSGDLFDAIKDHINGN